jgi:hypothetical protein
MATLLPEGKQSFSNSAGAPLVGGKVYTYDAGTSTPRPTYQDAAGTVPNTNPIVLDARGEATIFWNGNYKVILKDALDVTIWTVDNVQTATAASISADDGAAGALFTTVQGAITYLKGLWTTLASSVGASMVGFLQSASAAVVGRTVQSKLREYISAYDFLTTAEITAVEAYTYTTDVTAKLQAAIDEAWNTGKTLFIPAGGYLVTGLTLAGSSPNQNRILHIEGDGFGNPFTVGSARGTNIKSVTNAPVFQVTVPAIPTTAGTLIVRGIVFDGNSSTYPVVSLQSFYGVSEFSHNLVYQRGIGNGLEVAWMTTGEIHNCYFLNRDMVASGLGAARVGVGVYLNHQYDSGLQTIRKCTSRGWNKAYQIGNGALTYWTYNASIEDCECSVVYHGIHLTYNARSSWVNNCYLEGGEGGNALWDEGDYNKIQNCFTFAGFGTHLKSDSFTYGNVYTGNTLAAGTVASQTLISITSSSVNGGPGKVCSGNHLSFGGSGGALTNVIGLQINGLDPRIDLSGNNFYPRGAWVGGAGTVKILDGSSGGVYGLTVGQAGDLEFPVLSRGAISLAQGNTLSQANVSANILVVPEGSYFAITATAASTVTRLSCGGKTGRVIVFRTTNNNMTIQDSAFIQTAGGVSFSGPGTITFLVDRVGGSDYAWEIARTVF